MNRRGEAEVLLREGDCMASMLAQRALDAIGLESKMWLARDLRVSDPKLLGHEPGGLGIRGERRGDDLAQLIPPADRGEPLGLDDRGWIAASLGDELVEHLAPGADADLLRRHEANERSQRAWLDPRVGRVLALAQPRREIPANPVGQRLRRRRRVGLRSQCLLEVVAELAAEGQQLRALRR